MTDAFNYITPAGFRRLQEELARLWKVDRPAMAATVAWAAGNGDRSENGDYIYSKRKLREIDRRIRYLSKSLTARSWSTTPARCTIACSSAIRYDASS